jgi:hypothetical protein
LERFLGSINSSRREREIKHHSSKRPHFRTIEENKKIFNQKASNTTGLVEEFTRGMPDVTPILLLADGEHMARLCSRTVSVLGETRAPSHAAGERYLKTSYLS